jgi:hypothetical protein
MWAVQFDYQNTNFSCNIKGVEMYNFDRVWICSCVTILLNVGIVEGVFVRVGFKNKRYLSFLEM